MSKRKLKRQLDLAQVIMLGTAGTLAAEVFVLTGHAAGMAGPAAVLAFLVGGLLSYTIALNYCELATTYPVAGGAMSYVREAFGNSILSFLVGSMDCMSSTFYAALSAVGFAYSLQIFIPGAPIVSVAISVIGLFALLNITGVTRVGNVQILLGGILLGALVVFIAAGFIHPAGVDWETLLPGDSIFVHHGVWANLSSILATVALVYNAYVGFEVIADDAEEVRNPDRTIPLGILISLTLCTVLYVLVSLVTLGTVPWRELAGSETALTDAARVFLPVVGVPMMAVAGLIATLTSINSAMLSATREAFTLSRDGVWPRPLSRLSRFRTPHFSILAVGAVSALIAVIGLVDFLSYISSAGYLFVLFWGSLSMIRLRQRHPNLRRPFKAPCFPLTAYLAGATCLLIVAFADPRALLFAGSILLGLSLLYFARPRIARVLASRTKTVELEKDRILVAAGSPKTASSLVHLASIVAQASEDAYICVLTVDIAPLRPPQGTAGRIVGRLRPRERTERQCALPEQCLHEAQERNVALYTKSRTAPSIAQGILDELGQYNNVRMVLAGWPNPLNTPAPADNPIKLVLQRAHTNVVVLLDRGLRDVRRILVPVGGGLHSRLAIRLAYEVALVEDARITVLRVLPEDASPDEEEIEDKTLLMGETVEDVLGDIPAIFDFGVVQAPTIPAGVLAEAAAQPYDLIVMGASEEWALESEFFGWVDDWVADQAPCSVLLCRRYEPVAVSWLRRQAKIVGREYGRSNGRPLGHSPGDPCLSQPDQEPVGEGAQV